MPHSVFNSDDSWFKQLFDLSPDPTWIIEDNKFVECNEAAIRALGYASREELFNVHPSKLSPPTQPDGEDSFTKAERMMAIARDKGLHRFEWIHTKADGSNFVAEVTFSNIQLKERSLIYCALRDITERKQVEQSLQTSREHFRKLLEENPLAMALVGMDGTIEYINRKAIETFSYLPHDIPNMDRWWNQAYPDKTYRAEVMTQWFRLAEEALADKQEIAKREYFVTCKDGKVKTVAIFGVWVADKLLVVFEDITERKRDEADLVAAKAGAEKANLAKSRFLAAASHDLRQPLSALALYFDVLKSRVTPDNNELVSDIQVCVDSLNGLLSDLLDVSKLEAGAVKVKLSDVALNDILTPLVSVHTAEAHQQGLRLRLRMGARCAGMIVRTDPQLFKRILSNILVNAIRYTGKGGVLIACRNHQGRQWIEIWDTGIGIPADKVGIVFEEFCQLGDTARNRGSGLGLAIVAKTAELMGLKIRLRSRPGRGSMFAVELPAGRASATATLPPDSLPQTRFLRVGLVEDHPDVLRALTLVLKSLGHEVIAATSGKALIERLEDSAPDIVISDYRLAEGETGFNVIDAARDIFGEELPAFLITGDTDPAVVRSMAERGIAVLYKPLQMPALQAAISKTTERMKS